MGNIQSFSSFLLTEVLKGAEPFTWIYDNDEEMTVEFTINELVYVAFFVRYATRNDTRNPREYMRWEFVFSAQPSSLAKWRLAHPNPRRNDSDKSGYGIISTGNEFKVMATVVAIIRDFIAKKRPGAITFNADEPSRRKLYTKMMPLVPAEFPGYRGGPLVDETGPIPGYYMIQHSSYPPLPTRPHPLTRTVRSGTI